MLKIYNTLILLFAITITSAQEKIITGVVSDASGPLPGVSIVIKGTSLGTETDFDGKYTLKANIGDILRYTYIGYKSVEKTIGNSSIINLILKEDASKLEEVVVMGYGYSTKKSSTGSSIRIRGASSLRGKSSGIKILSDKIDLPQSGQLTAGEINDLNKWEEWSKIYKKNKEFLKVKSQWAFNLDNKIEVKVKNYEDKPLENIEVYLFDDKTLLSKMKTDVFGKAILFSNNNKNHTIQIVSGNKIKGIELLDKQDIVNFYIDDNKSYNEIDIMFTVDATGSMSDEINYLKAEIENIITRVDSVIKKKRVGLTFYRDHQDDYLTKDFNFTTDISKIKKNLIAQKADGGGDYEEAVEKALEVSLSKNWNIKAKTRLLFLVLDAPPHLNKGSIKIIEGQINKAKEMGVKVIPIVSSGADKQVEFLMRYFSIATNGTYVFLTDDSGIGNAHLKATTNSYKVEKLNDLIVRLIEKYAGV